jgi:hypothetical protein
MLLLQLPLEYRGGGMIVIASLLARVSTGGWMFRRRKQDADEANSKIHSEEGIGPTQVERKLLIDRSIGLSSPF